MAKCWFCEKQVDTGSGIIFVTIEGKIMNFCSSKCRKAFKHGRNKRKLKWASVEKEKEQKISANDKSAVNKS